MQEPSPETHAEKQPELEETRKRLDAVSPSFCLAKWKQVTLHLYKGTTQSCHHVNSHAIPAETLATPSNLHNTPQKMKTRAQMLKGTRPKECDYCWRVEDLGRLSDRTYKSSRPWASTSFDEVRREGVGATTTPSYLEVAFDSACQFKCMYCGPDYSTRWAKELEEHGAYPTFSGSASKYKPLKKDFKTPEERQAYVDAFWKWWPELAPRLHDLRVTGGEPLLSRDTIRLIDELIALPRPQLAFSINTNMGFRNEQREAFIGRIAKLQESVRWVTIFPSIDTVGAQAEYIRFGLDWNRFRENVELTLSTARKRLRMSFMITVNNLCLPGLRDLMAYILELRRRFPRHSIGFDTPYLRYPMFMSVQLLPASFATYVDETAEFMRAHRATAEPAGFSAEEIEKVNIIRDILIREAFPPLKKQVLQRDFYKMYVEYDRRRGTDFEKTFPEYREFMRDCRRWAFV